MKNKIKLLLLVPLLAIIFNFGNLQSYAATNETLDEINAIAQHTPQYVLGQSETKWNDVTAYNTEPLYDFNDRLVAYSVDLKSNVDGTEAYTIISASNEDAPVFEFCEGHTSPYDELDSNKKAIYDGVLSYFSMETTKVKNKTIDTFYDIKNNTKLTAEEVKILKDNNLQKKYVSSKPLISKSERDKLLSNNNDDTYTIMDTILTTKIISGVPDYLWYKGCAPTSAAMALKYDYSATLQNISSSTLISKLASYMGTDSSGGTYISNIPSGIVSTMAVYGNFNVVAYNNESGKSGSTFSKYSTDIDNNHPVLVTVIGSTETAPSYPNGFGNHTMCGVGYRITTSYSYVIVHDTGVDGNVYCNYDSSAFGTPTWTHIY